MSKPSRTLKLKDPPYMHGADVTALQHALGVTPDGEYGPKTATVMRARAERLGVLKGTIKKGATIGIQRILLGGKRTPAQVTRGVGRRIAAAKRRGSKPLRVRALELARLDVGKVYEVGGNNRGPKVEGVIHRNGGATGEAWCGDQVADWYKRAGSKLTQRMWASTIWLASNLTRVRNPMAGHIVVYDFGTGTAQHTGLFDEWIDHEWFWAIEGNTRNHSAVSDGSGGRDGVCRQKRHVSQVKTYRRVNA